MVEINGELYVSWHDLQQYGYTASYLSKVTTLFRKGIRSTYENINVTPELRAQLGIDPAVRNLIKYRSIPADAIAERSLPSEAQLRAQMSIRSMEDLVRDFAALHLDQAINYFKSNPHTYPHNQELAAQACWLLFLASMKPSRAKALGSPSVEDLYIKAIELMQLQGWKRWKCNSLQVLRRKLKPFIRLFKKPLNGDFTVEDLHGALSSLVHKNFGNKNREKLTEAIEAALFCLYANGDAKLTETQVYALYTAKAMEKIAAGEWDESALISLSTIRKFLQRPDIRQAWTALRHGSKEYANRYLIVTHRRPTSIANGLWVIDGTDWHRYYQQGDNAYARLNVFVVLDAHSWCVLGFYVSDHENNQQVRGALRSAVMLTGGYIPHQIQSDNAGPIIGYHGKRCIDVLTPHFTPAAVGNARSKIIEPFFRQYNSRVQRIYPGFAHSPVMSNTLNGKPNREALSLALRNGKLPDKETAIRELHEGFGVWNRLPFKDGPSPLERYKQSLEASQAVQRRITEDMMVEAFYHMPGVLKTVKGIDARGQVVKLKRFIPELYTYTNNGIGVELNGKREFFWIDDPEINAQLIDERVFIRYDEQNPEKLYLYKPIDDSEFTPLKINGQHLVARHWSDEERFAHALIDMKEGEHKRLHEHLGKKKAQKAIVADKAQRYERLAKAEGVFIPITPHNAFPKEALSDAKREIAERIANGHNRLMESGPDQLPEHNDPTDADYSRWE